MRLRELVSKKLVASVVPAGCSQGENGRAVKKPSAPHVKARLALATFMTLRARSPFEGPNSNHGHGEPEVTCVQNSRSRSTREAGGLPAMIAALIAPMEIPAIQLG